MSSNQLLNDAMRDVYNNPRTALTVASVVAILAGLNYLRSPRCPNCRSQFWVRLVRGSGGLGLFGFIACLLNPFWMIAGAISEQKKTAPHWHCRACGHKWEA